MTTTSGHPVDICMLACNRRRITKTSVAEIVRRTTTPHRLTVYDNGSTDGTLDLLEGLLDEGKLHRLVSSAANDGVHAGFNELLRFAESDLYVCTDNDLVPQAPLFNDWLALLVGLMDRHPDYAAIACLPHALVGDSLQSWLEGAPEVIERPWCGAALRLMRTAAVKSVGGWRTDAGPSRDNEERWICTKLREEGWKVGYAGSVRCLHLWGKPELGEDEWGYPPGTEHGHHPVWPPVSNYNWDKLGINWETCVNDKP